VLNCIKAPRRELLEQLVADVGSTCVKFVLNLGGLNTEHWVVHRVVGDTLNLFSGIVVFQDFSTNYFNIRLFGASFFNKTCVVEQFFLELLSISVENEFILLVFSKKSQGSNSVSVGHSDDLLLSIYNPREVLSDGEIGFLLILILRQVLHEVLFKNLKLVCSFNDGFQSLAEEILALLEGRRILNLGHVLFVFSSLGRQKSLFLFFLHFLSDDAALRLLLFVFSGLAHG